MTDPWGLAFDASGNLYVSNYGNGNGLTVTKITPDGTQSTFANGLVGPGGLAFDQNGNLFVANIAGTTITEITPAGVKSTFASGFTQPDEPCLQCAHGTGDNQHAERHRGGWNRLFLPDRCVR